MTISEMRLYEIATIRERLDAAIAEAEGELTPDYEKALDEVDGSFEEKAERCGLFVKERLATAEAIKVEEDRLAARRKALVRDAEGVTGYLAAQMQRVGKEKVNGLLCTLSFRKAQKVEEIVAPTTEDLRTVATFAPDLVRHKEIWEWDKEAVKRVAKAGPLPDDIAKRVRVVTTSSLQIK